ncbi:hypothetical protein DFP72DRAFT_855076 [Ephemerocybe angulata]|uniref:Uncharacterized protein n=1 Tax=Ephemerocybe angulata TaxID=980116 RepID=A0A8H6LWP0_9AGAR|nr:hypothetical protein DFP72DRAFT_855076 [Tulosesus angulatus]
MYQDPPARNARARVAEVRSRIDEAIAGLGGIKRECDKKRDRIRKLREDLAQRRRTLGAARILVKAATPTSPPTSATPKSAPFLSTPLPDGHPFQPDSFPPFPVFYRGCLYRKSGTSRRGWFEVPMAARDGVMGTGSLACL